MKTRLLTGFAVAVLVGPLLAAGVEGASNDVPKIQFETNFFDFGTVMTTETLSGAFKFKNTGTGVLKLEPPQASCDCTEPKVVPDTVAPGESGVVNFTIKLDRAINAQRHIWVRSNDLKTPRVELTFQMDYTPLYALSPMKLNIALPASKDEVRSVFLVTRADGRPFKIVKLTTSQDWISAVLDTSFKGEANVARINVTVRRPPGPPAPVTASIEMWDAEALSTRRAMRTMAVSAQIQGELKADPAAFYWVIPDYGKNKAAYPIESLTRKIALKSVLGNPVEIKNVTTNIKGLRIEVVTQEPGKAFNLVLEFDELPQAFTTNGTVTVESSLASTPKLEIPITVAVPQ